MARPPPTPARHVDQRTKRCRGSVARQVRLSRALHQVLGCQKTYIAQFAEAEGFSHVHFHVVPRPPNLPQEFRGPGIFQMMRPDRPPVTEQRMDWADSREHALDLVEAALTATGPVQGSVVGPIASLPADVMKPGVFVEVTPAPEG
jgi:hypothetical protein